MPTPTITAVSPSSGLNPNGGDTITLTGTNFNNANVTAVKFGTQNATSFTIISGTQITAVAPQKIGVPTVDITATNSSGTSTTSSADQVTYSSSWSQPGIVAADETPTSTDAAAFTAKVSIGLDPVFFIPLRADYPLPGFMFTFIPQIATGGSVSIF